MPFSFVLLLVFSASFTVTALWLVLALRRLWFDHPNFRSAHSFPVPKSGGVGFVAVFAVYVLWSWHWGFVSTSILLALSPSLALAITGLFDDFRDLSIRLRLCVQFIAVLVSVLVLDIEPVLVFPGFSIDTGLMAIPLLVVSMVWLVNLYNFMDGIDAMAAMECIFISLALAWFSSRAMAEPVFMLSLVLVAGVTGFLYFNLPGARLFMGDLGSNFLGFVLGILSLLALQAGAVNVWTIMVLFSIFLLDSTTTLTGRIRAGLVWYHGHNSHVYQRAAVAHSSHGKVVAGVTLINVFWILPAAILTVQYPEAGVLVLAIAWAPLLLLGCRYRRDAMTLTGT